MGEGVVEGRGWAQGRRGGHRGRVRELGGEEWERETRDRGGEGWKAEVEEKGMRKAGKVRGSGKT